MKKIPVTGGLLALVDDEDYPTLSLLKWHKQPGANTWYAATNVLQGDGKYSKVLMHRMINKTPAGFDTDHRDGNGLNNTRLNLRTATRTQNQRNRSPNRRSTSRHKGVYWLKDRSRWHASITINGRLHHLGNFVNEVDAAKAYAERAAKEYGEFHRSEA